MLDDAIQGYGADAIVTACSSQSTATFKSPACDLIVRAPGTESIWLTPTGYVIDTPNNNGQVKTDGLDFNAAYNHGLGSLGRLSFSFNGTYLLNYKVDNGLTEPYNCAGLFGPVCSGFAIARFLGTSSPNTIDNAVAIASASASDSQEATDPGTFTAVRAGWISDAIAGSAM